MSSDPDIIALQEVRLDSSFLSPHSGHSLPHWQNLRLHKPDAGNQAEHVLSYLAQARARAATSATAADAGVSGKAAAGKMDDDDAFSLPFYQFVFQPAMSLIDRYLVFHVADLEYYNGN